MCFIPGDSNDNRLQYTHTIHTIHIMDLCGCVSRLEPGAACEDTNRNHDTFSVSSSIFRYVRVVPGSEDIYTLTFSLWPNALKRQHTCKAD